MAYRQPGVRLTQEFSNLAPALALFSLPNVNVGPAFQVLADDVVGSYAGLSVSVSYLGKIAGAIVDARLPNPSDLLDYPVIPSLKNLTVVWKASAATGSVAVADLRKLTDSVSGAFASVQTGDKIVVTAPLGVAGTYSVTEKVDNENIKFDVPFASAQATVTYSITRAVAGPVVIPADTVGMLIDPNQVTIPAALTYLDPVSLTTKVILSAQISLKYRALRTEYSTYLKEYKSVSELQADFGIDQIVPENVVVYAAYLALQNSVTATNILELGQEYLTLNDEVLAHQKALDILKITKMYAINLLTQVPVIHANYKSHVNGMSTADKKKWRVVVSNRTIKTVLMVADTQTTSAGSSIIVAPATDGVVLIADLDKVSTVVANGFSDVKVGDKMVVTGGTNAVAGTVEVIAKISSVKVQLSAPVASGSSSNIAYSVDRLDGMSPDGSEINFQAGAFITSGASTGMFVKVLSGSTGTPIGRFKIASVVSQTRMTLFPVAGPVAGTSTFSAVSFQIDRDMTKAEQAAFIKTYSQSLGSRRVVMVWPDVCKVLVSNAAKKVPGFFLGSSVAALTTGLPTQQGFTNLGVSGFVGVEHSSIYFDDDQMNDIADGGTMIFAQEILDESQVYIRHQLTTDRSSIKFQEYSVTKNVDFISYFIVQQSGKYIGQYNIYEGLFDDLRLNAQSIISFLKDNTRVPKFGGVITKGSLSDLRADPTQIDTVLQVYSMTIPIPLNNLDIRLIV
jgi:hypothetical protein